jgi:hypothetical protein
MMLDLRGPHTGLAIDSGANSAFVVSEDFQLIPPDSAISHLFNAIYRPDGPGAVT